MRVKSSSRETPFSLVYRFATLILIEIVEPSLRFAYVAKNLNDEAFTHSLDLVEW